MYETFTKHLNDLDDQLNIIYLEQARFVLKCL